MNRLRVAVLLAAGLFASLPVAHLLGGANALIGWVLGILGGAVAVFGNVRLVNLIGREGAAPRTGVAVTMVALLMKLPAVALCAWLAGSRGTKSLAAFTIAIVLVYSALGWLCARKLPTIHTEAK